MFYLPMHVWAEKILIWIAWQIPQALASRVFARIVGHATTGKYGSTVLPELTVVEALKRWGTSNAT